MIPFQCPNCKVKFELRDEFAGKAGKCPKCAHQLKVPAGDSSLQPAELLKAADPAKETVEYKPAPGLSEPKLWEQIVGNIIAGPFVVFLLFLAACGLQWCKKKFWASSEPITKGAYTETRIWDAVYMWQFWVGFAAVSLVISSILVIKTIKNRPRG